MVANWSWLAIVFDGLGRDWEQVWPTEPCSRSTDLLPKCISTPLSQVRSANYRARSTDLLSEKFSETGSGRPSSVAGRPTCCCLAYFAYFAWFSNLIDSCYFPICCYHLLLTLMTYFLREFLEYPFRWIRYRFLWILFTSSNMNFSD